MVGISPYPFLLYRGGAPDALTGQMTDPEGNVEFFLKVECSTCGNATFINSARHRTDDEPVLEASPPKP